MKHSEKNPMLFFSIIVAALFLLGFLLLVAFGAKSYRGVVDSQYGNMDERALTAYIVASVKANDALCAVSVEDSDWGQVLVVTDGDTGYALRYYRYDGHLVEDFAKEGAPLSPENAQPIAPTSVFSVVSDSGALLSVTTDAGRTLQRLRCGEEETP